MIIVNFIDKLSDLNFGIWNAAIYNSLLLSDNYNITSYLMFSSTQNSSLLSNQYKVILQRYTIFNLFRIRYFAQSLALQPKNTIIITHGTWGLQTWFGFFLHCVGYKWIYVPHGMLEPWSLKEKHVKKSIYFYLIEYNLSKFADLVRAVSANEAKNLNRFYKNVFLQPNGINTYQYSISPDNRLVKNILFMARLHHKKGIIPLVQAWLLSNLNNNETYKLIIAGKDDGELQLLQKHILSNKTNNVAYVGTVYNQDKINVLKQSSFFILPSFSEGFPTSIVEALDFGLIPIITDGCNFPELFEEQLAIKITTEINSICSALNSLQDIDNKQMIDWSKRCTTYVRTNYSAELLTEKQIIIFRDLFHEK